MSLHIINNIKIYSKINLKLSFKQLLTKNSMESQKKKVELHLTQCYGKSWFLIVFIGGIYHR